MGVQQCEDKRGMEEGHDKIVAEVMRRLEENNLYVKLEKCKWKVRKVGFLGVVIGPERIKMEKEKIKGVLKWLTPMCVKDVQKFLELANYYCQFIQSFVTIARPLHNIVKKNKKWDCPQATNVDKIIRRNFLGFQALVVLNFILLDNLLIYG